MQQYYYVKSNAMSVLMLQQIALQRELIEMQRQLIAAQKEALALHKKLDKKTPENPDDSEVFWHIASGGILSTEAANSKDLALVRKFQEWNEAFAKKHVKPYVNPKVYNECLNQMTRGLPERIAALQTKADLAILEGNKSPSGSLALVR